MLRFSHRRRRLLAAGLGALTTIGAATALGTSASALGSSGTATGYVALGDSYASGTGTRSYLPDGTSCQRSTYAYPSLDAAALGLSLDFRACSGATVADVTNTQLAALSSGTGYVTISAGGNDAGFSSVLTTCAQPSWMSNCPKAIDGAQSVITNTIPGRLASLYASIRAKAPNAKVIVVGYPRIFNGEDCNAFTWFSPTEEARLNAMADLLNSRTASAAAARGFTFVNPVPAFVGHAVCDSPEWLNGLSSPITESYHPNRSGHASGFVPLTQPAFGTRVVLGRAEAAAASHASSAALTRKAARWSDLDRTVTPKPFVAPDLTTSRARAAAQAAGVDLSSRASIDRADRLFGAAQDAAHAASPSSPR